MICFSHVPATLIALPARISAIAPATRSFTPDSPGGHSKASRRRAMTQAWPEGALDGVLARLTPGQPPPARHSRGREMRAFH